MKMPQLVTYECISCGKKRTAPLWRFKKPRDEYMCQSCSSKARAHDPVWLEKVRLGALKRAQDPIWRANNKKANQKSAQNPVYKENHKKIMGELSKDPTWLANQKVGAQKRENNPVSVKNRNDAVRKTCKDPTWLANQTIRNRNIANDPNWIEQNKLGAKKRSEDPKFKENCKNTQQKKMLEDPEFRKNKVLTALKNSKDPKWIENTTIANRAKAKDPEFRERLLVGITGQGFWYGHPILHDTPTIYCELWKDVNPRVHAFFNYECCECGEKENGRSHIGHHVFYVKEACCWKSEDGVYYTNLNVKTHDQNDYFIGKNPNYFVILCPTCHGKTNGTFENRKKWANHFRNMIDEEYDGKCYFTKEEYKIYKSNK